MAKPITGKTHVGERREKRQNGDIYVYERVTVSDVNYFVRFATIILSGFSLLFFLSFPY